jgi:sortase A
MTDRQTAIPAIPDQPVVAPPDERRRARPAPGAERWRRFRNLRPGHVPTAPDATTSDATGAETDQASDAGPQTGEGRAAFRRRRWEIVGVVLTAVGMLAALFLVYLFAFTPLTHERAQHQMLQGLVNDPHRVFELTKGHVPAEGDPVAVLRVPAIHVDQVVVVGTSSADLEKGPGLSVGTALPGAPGNAVIAGRRVTFGGPFAQLSTLTPGDTIRVVDGVGSFRFRIVSVSSAGAGDQVRPGGSARSWLTLVTSASGLASTSRTVVVARIVGTPGKAAPIHERSPGTAALLGFGGDPAALLLAAVWFVAFVLLLLAALVVARRWDKPWVVYMFSAPVLIAFGLFACESLARCLPATL